MAFWISCCVQVAAIDAEDPEIMTYEEIAIWIDTKAR